MKNSILSLAVAVLLTATWFTPARGAVLVAPGDWGGVRTTLDGGGLLGAGLWDGVTPRNNQSGPNNGFQIAWEITLDPDTNQFTYRYTISGVGGEDLTRGLSHWILELSATVDWSTTDFGNAFDGLRTDLTNPDRWEPGGSNPDMPGELAGVKFNGGGKEESQSFQFVSAQQPVWGSFYAVDGRNPTTYAYNLGFTSESTIPPDGTTNFTNWIAVPDTDVPFSGPGGVPEPSAFAVWGLLGIVGLAWRIRRKVRV